MNRRLARAWCYLRGAHSWEWSSDAADVECWRCGYRYGRPPADEDDER